LFCATSAWAGPVKWSYDWTVGPSLIPSDVFGKGSLQVADDPSGTHDKQGSQDTLVASLFTAIDLNLSDSEKVFFDHSPTISMMLSLQDSAAAAASKPNASTTLTFTGHFTGFFTKNDASAVGFSFDQKSSGPVQLGDNTYIVSFTQPNAYVAPDFPGSTTAGAITAHVDVSEGGGEPPPPASDTPEPSTLVLAGLGLSCATLVLWRR
jgi:hypothetical protein